MHFAFASAVLSALAVSTASAQQTHQVRVGGSSLAFSPNQIQASVGDSVEFIFLPKNHTVTQSTFTAPCLPMANGTDSGFQPVAANSSQSPSMTIQVNVTTPLWFFCRQTSHCEQGMVFAINPTANKTFEAFQAAANASSPNGSPASNSTSSSPSGDSSARGSTASSSSPASSATSKPNSAVAIGARAGGLLAIVGFAAGILL